MANLPAGYPHGVSDDDIRRVLGELADDIYRSGGNINTTLQLGPLVSAGQMELLARDSRNHLGQLASAIETFRSSSEKASDVLIRLTIVLVVVTVC